MRNLLDTLISEMGNKNKNGIYHKLQIDFAYNSNHIEGSKLTHEQTRYIFDTKTIDVEHSENIIKVNDIIETVNHFKCFDFILNSVHEPLTEEYIKTLHRILKSGIIYDDVDVVVGEYKKYPNEVETLLTVQPEDVSFEIQRLTNQIDRPPLSLYEIAAFHAYYEKIHPFYDGNGRTGRLIMFKQCLENDVIPFFIDDSSKLFYYKGLEEWQQNISEERLVTVFLAAQDSMERILKYFRIENERPFTSCKDIIANRKLFDGLGMA